MEEEGGEVKEEERTLGDNCRGEDNGTNCEIKEMHKQTHAVQVCVCACGYQLER